MKINLGRLYQLCYEQGAKDPVRVAWGVKMAVEAGMPFRDAIDSLRRNQPRLFHCWVNP